MCTKDIHGRVLIHVLDCHLDRHLNQHLDRYSISFLINTWPTEIDIRFISILIDTRSTLDWHSVNNWQSVNLLIPYILTYTYFFILRIVAMLAIIYLSFCCLFAVVRDICPSSGSVKVIIHWVILTSWLWKLNYRVPKLRGIIWRGKSEGFDWLFLGGDFAIWTISMETVLSFAFFVFENGQIQNKHGPSAIKLLTNRAILSHTGEYWPSVVFVQTKCSHDLRPIFPSTALVLC